jgi:hypothetical protein
LQDSGRVADARIEKIIADREREIRDHKEASSKREEEKRRERDLENAWRSAFTEGPELTDALAREAAQRFLSLSELLRARFWDFHVAEWLCRADLPWQSEIYFRLLSHACVGNGSELLASLIRIRSNIYPVVEVHRDYLEVLRVAEEKGLPFTPPLSQSDLTKTIEVSYDKFRWDFHQDRWQTQAVDAVKYQRLRRWRHVDAPTQENALKKIRENRPEKLWWKLSTN